MAAVAGSSVELNGLAGVLSHGQFFLVRIALSGDAGMAAAVGGLGTRGR